MAKICLVSCVSSKRSEPSPARDLYTSPLFLGARHFAESRFDRWFILSAKYGLVEPGKRIEPYEKTLKNMPLKERRAWAQEVFKKLSPFLRPGDHLSFLAGEDYREFLLESLAQAGTTASIPLEGVSIERQLSYFKKFREEEERLKHLDRLYGLLERLKDGVNGRRRMRECTGAMSWPEMGVYFFFEDGQRRTTAPWMYRVVRVGTHTVSKGSKTTLWHRLRTHRGGADLSGNHRGSIFRLHTGAALIARDALRLATWGKGQSASAKIREAEAFHEKAVSQFIGNMTLLWLAIGDEAGPTSDRSYIERNSIALLSGGTGPLDRPGPHWLGLDSPREAIRKSGLWNLNYVEDSYDPGFLEVFEEYVAITLGQKSAPGKSIAPEGWYRALKKENKGETRQMLMFEKKKQ